jgi:hypothetical protein
VKGAPVIVRVDDVVPLYTPISYIAIKAPPVGGCSYHRKAGTGAAGLIATVNVAVPPAQIVWSNVFVVIIVLPTTITE